MNERIKQLAEQARELATTRHPVSNITLSVNSDKFEQKFAELIVRDAIRNLEEFDREIICEDFGLEYKPNMMENPDYGDLFTADEWLEASDAGYFISDDGSGYWATEKEHSTISCWSDQPSWATHVLWFNK